MTTLRIWDPNTSSWVAPAGPQGPQGAQGPAGPAGALGATGPAGAPGTIGTGSRIIAVTGLISVAQSKNTEYLNNNVNGNAAGWYRISGWARTGYPSGGGPAQGGLVTTVQVTDDSGNRNTYYPACITSTGIITTFYSTNLGGAGVMNVGIEIFPITVHQPVAGSANRVSVWAYYFSASQTTSYGYASLLLEQLTTS